MEKIIQAICEGAFKMLHGSGVSFMFVLWAEDQPVSVNSIGIGAHPETNLQQAHEALTKAAEKLAARRDA